ncbi:hypothetical protein, partial [uncultured Muribaculum sp.]|uniref:hypothetical protein n=1 Tax=uncultured Muribaculum sp. TaxID=1918613 RepID=UPI00266F2584
KTGFRRHAGRLGLVRQAVGRQADDNLQPRGQRGHHGGHAACGRRVHCRGLGRADVNRGRNSLTDV